MNRKEYDLVFQALKNYRLYMTKEQEVLSEKILDDLFYPEFDKYQMMILTSILIGKDDVLIL